MIIVYRYDEVCYPGYSYWGTSPFNDMGKYSRQPLHPKYQKAYAIFKKIGHFSAVVWRRTKKFGFAITKRKLSQYDCNVTLPNNIPGSPSIIDAGPTGCTCWWGVAHYRSPGNLPGRFKWNVKKGAFNPNTHCAKDQKLYDRYIKMRN